MSEFIPQVRIFNSEGEALAAGIGNSFYRLGSQVIVATDAAIAEASTRAKTQKHPKGVEVNESELLSLKLWDLFASSWQP